MITYIVFLQRQGALRLRLGSYKLLSKRVKINAISVVDMKCQVDEKYPDWQISMFWPEVKNNYVH